MLNSYEHDEADELAESVAEALPAIERLLEWAAGDSSLTTVYVNDNYGDWGCSLSDLGERALQGRHPELVEPVLPPDGTDFVVKARHSIFYGTSLEYLLDSRGIERLILIGQVTEQCILYSALDAYVRHFEVVVPRDGVAHIHTDLAEAALAMMERNMSAEVTDSTGLIEP